MDYPWERSRPARRPLTLLGSLAGRVRSLGYCWSGLVYLFRQPASMFHLSMSVAVLAVSAALGLAPEEWRWVVLAMLLVWVTEAVNTAIEYACDAVSPGYSLAVKKAKDIAAGAVLLAALGAAAMCILTWWPHLAH